MTRHRDVRMIEDAMAVLRNCGATLTGNTQGSDLEWLARILFESSALGAGDVRTIPWLIGQEEFEYLGLTRKHLMGDGPRFWDALDAPQKEAWRKLARICMWCLPAFADRVGSRFMEQAKALEAVWRQERGAT